MKMGTSDILTICGIILAAIVAASLSIKQVIDTKKAEEKADSLNTKLTNLSLETVNRLTGGKTYIFFQPIGITESVTGTLKWAIFPSSNADTNLPNVTVVLSDYQKFHTPGVNLADMKLWRTSEFFNSIDKSTATIWKDYNFKDLSRLEFTFEILAQNGRYTQNMKGIFINGKWNFAYKVTKTDDPNNQIIKVMHYDPDFPLTNNGDVDWGNINPYLPL